MKKEYDDIEFEMFTMPWGTYQGWSISELPPSFILFMLEKDYCPDVLRAYGELYEEELREKVEYENSYYDCY